MHVDVPCSRFLGSGKTEPGPIVSERMILRNLVIKAVLALVVGASVFAHADAVQIFAPEAASGAITFAWGGFGDVNPLPSGTSISVGSFAMTTTSSDALTTFLESPTGSYNGSFIDGAGVLATFDLNGAGPVASTIELDFSQGLDYLGTYAEGQFTGPYTISMALYSGATLIDTFSVMGNQANNNDGSAPFIGFRGTNIDRVVFSAVDGTNSPTAFAVSDVTAAVPEPGSILLLGAGLASIMGAIRRKRQN